MQKLTGHLLAFSHSVSSLATSKMDDWEQIPKQLSSSQRVLVNFKQIQGAVSEADTQLSCMLVIQQAAYETGIHQ